MGAVAFDTLKLARKLQDTAKMPQIQAEGVADALAEAMSGAELATKSDIRELELKMDARFTEIAGQFKETDARIDALSERTDARFEMVLERIDRRAAESDTRLQALKTAQFRWLFTGVCSIIVTIIGTAVAIIRYLPDILHH